MSRSPLPGFFAFMFAAVLLAGCGRETAPAGASRTMFLAPDGKPLPDAELAASAREEEARRARAALSGQSTTVVPTPAGNDAAQPAPIDETPTPRTTAEPPRAPAMPDAKRASRSGNRKRATGTGTLSLSVPTGRCTTLRML